MTATRKIAWFNGDCLQPERIGTYSFDEILRMPPALAPVLRVLLVPYNFDLLAMRGDDWNDAPADINAGEPYDSTLPTGSRWIELRLGDHLV